MTFLRKKFYFSIPGWKNVLFPPIMLLFFLSIGCGSFVNLKKNEDFNNLDRKVDVLETKTDAAFSVMRDDIHELQVKTGLAGGGQASPQPAVPSMNMSPGQVKAEYDRARKLYLKRDLAGAAPMFANIVSGAPNDKLAPNAQYWLGECYYSQALFNEAISEFQKVIDNYPASPKAPDAMLKIAYSHHMLKDGKTAMAGMRDLLKRYPKSRAASMIRKGQTVFPNP